MPVGWLVVGWERGGAALGVGSVGWRAAAHSRAGEIAHKMTQDTWPCRRTKAHL